MNQVLGKYELLGQIATGGMTEIFLGCQRQSKGKTKLVMIKRLLPHLAEDSKVVQLFLNEARIIARINHDNVVQIYDLGQAQDTYYIVMEYVQGANINMIMQRCSEIQKFLPLPLTLQIIVQISQVLHYAHVTTKTLDQSLNTVQGVVTPQNIVVSFHGAVKLVGFGIPRAATMLEQSASSKVHNKFGYLSPEQCMGQTHDVRSDVFSLGILFWELCTCRRLFRRPSSMQTARAIMSGKIESPKRFNPEIPREIASIIMRALQVDPTRRYQTLQKMGRILERETLRLGLVSGEEQLGSFMSRMFADKLANLSRIIESQRKGPSMTATPTWTIGSKIGAVKSRSKHKKFIRRFSKRDER